MDLDDSPTRFRRAPARAVVPMRRVWIRDGEVSAVTDSNAGSQAVDVLRAEATRDSNNRDKRARLARSLAANGLSDELERELHVWESRDPFDVELLALRAQLSMQRGRTAEALRRYSGILASPTLSSVDSQKWALSIARAFEHEHSPFACAIRLGAAENTQSNDDADRAMNCATTTPPEVSTAKSDLRAVLDSQSQSLFDVLMLDSDGRLLDPNLAQSTEAQAVSVSGGVALEKAKMGSYRLVLRKRTGVNGSNFKGTLKVTSFGQTRDIPFTFNEGKVAQVAAVKLSWKAQLIPMDDDAPWNNRPF
jgi:hypothetical protein